MKMRSTLRRRALRITHLCVFMFLLAIVAEYHTLLGIWGVIGVPVFVGLIMAWQYLHAIAKIEQEEQEKTNK
jgi:hypothetical protein